MSDHEKCVAEHCRAFLSQISSSLGEWGELLGRWHDIGKYSDEFQAYLRASNDIHSAEIASRVDHSTAAAQLAQLVQPAYGQLLSYIFAGHHAGLPDWDDGESQKGLKQRLARDVPDWQTTAPQDLQSLAVPDLWQLPKTTDRVQAAFRVAFWIRMMFSALVDSDFLATEAFLAPERTAVRPQQATTLERMAELLEEKTRSLMWHASETPLNQQRKLVSQECFDAASQKPGFFSLCVPTGGGKTLASLRFALNHANQHQLRRIIFAVPFTSIIEQNADVYRELFSELGPETVLEHHSNLTPKKETTTNRLQAENWDAPLVVTTNVQLFESLFAYRTSRCRKLHRIAGSVIVLDEAQSLPIELLEPTLLALKELVETYGCTVVLCSATQPALTARDDFGIGISNVREIIGQPKQLQETLRRTKVEIAGALAWSEVASRLSSDQQCLCIVNTRKDAAELFDQITADAESKFHLSTRMCPEHRSDQFKQIKGRLAKGRDCRVVSTQLIEAGVDIDFPRVYRAECGLDSLAQAAGRCNREGKLDHGTVTFFRTETPPPSGFLRQSADTACELIDKHRSDLLSIDAVNEYFELQYWKRSDAWDKHDVLKAFGSNPSKLQFNFRDAGDRYRFIREVTHPVVIPFDDSAMGLVDTIRHVDGFLPRSVLRALQRYCVQVRGHELRQLVEAGAIEHVDQFWVLTHAHLYDEKRGLLISQADGILPVEDCFV